MFYIRSILKLQVMQYHQYKSQTLQQRVTDLSHHWAWQHYCI